jgi:hypothetical protein
VATSLAHSGRISSSQAQTFITSFAARASKNTDADHPDKVHFDVAKEWLIGELNNLFESHKDAKKATLPSGPEMTPIDHDSKDASFLQTPREFVPASPNLQSTQDDVEVGDRFFDISNTANVGDGDESPPEHKAGEDA